MFHHILKGISKQRNFFLLSFVIISVLALFLMNFVSLPALLFDREIIFAPMVGVLDIVFLFAFVLFASTAVTLQKNQIDTLPKSAGFFGGLFGMAASACPFCQSLVLTTLAVAGLPISLQALPLHGEEFKLASLIFLGTAIYMGAKDCKECRI